VEFCAKRITPEGIAASRQFLKLQKHNREYRLRDPQTGQTHLDFSASKFPLKWQALKKKITAKSK
jgi:hypothetical protein